MPPPKVIVEDLGLHNIDQQNKTINSAIVQLEIGQIKKAEKNIDQVLDINPSHKIAKLLKKQLTLSYSQIFKTTRTINYQIKSGDSLGSIAKQWLGDPIYFVSLAKLNQIKNPTKIRSQSLIKIPVLNSSPLVKREKRRSNANISLLKKYVSEKRLTKSLKRMTSIYIIKSHHKRLLKLQKETLKKLGISKVSITERVKMLEDINEIVKKSKRQFLNRNFNQFTQQQTQSILFDEFILFFDAGNYQKSADNLIRAKQIKLKNKSTKDYSATEIKLIEKLHEQAIILRKDQKLQQAIDSWALILKIQPDNELALKYHQRTNRLLERLKQL